MSQIRAQSLRVSALGLGAIFFLACSKNSAEQATKPHPNPILQRAFNDGWIHSRNQELDEKMLTEKREKMCEKLNQRFKEYRWKDTTCRPEDWKVGGLSVKGEPLLYREVGDIENKLAKTTVILCGVHGDEITPLFVCFKFPNSNLFKDGTSMKGHRVVIAPLINPDGFLSKPPKRTNANGVDLNRNFATQDWEKAALREWEKVYKKDKRKFPGERGNSEPETMFQVWLIDHYKPDKMISAHSPLRFIDYDGPGDQKHQALERHQHRARFLAMNISKNSQSPLVDYKFFPGSLGNYSGQEHRIPTYTLEFSSSDPRHAESIWARFEFALTRAIRFEVRDEVVLTEQSED